MSLTDPARQVGDRGHHDGDTVPGDWPTLIGLPSAEEDAATGNGLLGESEFADTAAGLPLPAQRTPVRSEGQFSMFELANAIVVALGNKLRLEVKGVPMVRQSRQEAIQNMLVVLETLPHVPEELSLTRGNRLRPLFLLWLEKFLESPLGLDGRLGEVQKRGVEDLKRKLNATHKRIYGHQWSRLN